MSESAYDSRIRERIEAKEQQLSPFASKSLNSKGRVVPEAPPQIRGEYQRDRDRILHTNAFRRLKHKTQVFIAPSGDHYVTRLTHTLEVAQIGRTIARALNLNEDLIEAIALGHDLGHTPFGHVGEEMLDQLSETGFVHSTQSLRIGERLAKNGEGRNLTWEVREGVLNHSKPRGDFLRPGREEDITLEAQICRASDAIAYLNHDIGDAIRAGILSADELPAEVNARFGKSHASRINSLVCDIVDASWAVTGEEGSRVDAEIIMSDDGRRLMNLLREFMFDNVYMPINGNAESTLAREIMGMLHRHLIGNPDLIPDIYFLHEESVDQAVIDYLSGMTDYYAISLAERIKPGSSKGLSFRIVHE